MPRSPADKELSQFGQRVDAARRRKGLSKLGLADQLGISRSTFWRQITGKSDVTLVDVQRYAHVLGVDVAYLSGETESEQWEPTNQVSEATPSAAGAQLEEFVSNIDRVVRMLSSGEGARMGPKSKLAIMNGIEEAARLAGQTLPREFYDIRRRINEGSL